MSSGCVRVYQPMSGLHRPIVVDPGAANFTDLDLTLRCTAGNLLNRVESRELCRKVGLLFENQGARVHIVAEGGASGPSESEEPAVEEEPRPIALSLDLSARKEHVSRHPMSWVFFAMSFTLAPGMAEHSFIQDLSIRDDSGFLLASESLEGRLVEYVGLGPWAGHKLLDATVRSKEERVMGEAMGEDISADVYGQLSQILFNAKIAAQVLDEAGGTR